MYENLLHELRQNIKSLNPFKAILFGSFASGIPQIDSDIDLVVVLNQNDLPHTFNERMENYISVKKYFKSLNTKVPMDIIVYTKAEWNELLSTNNSFCQEILNKGISLL